VIVPVYNAEQYLPMLFDSILNQTYKDFLVLVVDDCSTDNSVSIIKEYMKNNNMKIVLVENEENIKQSKSRNKALEIAKDYPSKYTTFLDSDDWIEPDFFEQLVKSAELSDADVTICGIERFDDKTNRQICVEAVDGKTVNVADGENICELAYINPALYNKLFRTEIAQKAIFREMKRSEDTCYFFEILRYVNKLVYTNKVGYHYRVRSDSLTGIMDAGVCDSMMSGFRELISNNPIDGLYYRQELETQIFIRIACGGVFRTSIGNSSGKKELIKKTIRYMDDTIPGWRTNRYLGLFGKNINLKALALRLCALSYRVGMVGFFIGSYKGLIKIFGREVRM